MSWRGPVTSSAVRIHRTTFGDLMAMLGASSLPAHFYLSLPIFTTHANLTFPGKHLPLGGKRMVLQVFLSPPSPFGARTDRSRCSHEHDVTEQRQLQDALTEADRRKDNSGDAFTRCAIRCTDLNVAQCRSRTTGDARPPSLVGIVQRHASHLCRYAHDRSMFRALPSARIELSRDHFLASW